MADTESLSGLLLPGDPGFSLSAASKAYTDAQVATRIPLSDEGIANGVATLDAASKLTFAQLPGHNHSTAGDIVGGFRYVRRTSAVSVLNNATTFTSSGLSFTVTANGVYEVEGLLNVQGAQAGDITFSHSGPSMSSFLAQVTGMGTSFASSEGSINITGSTSLGSFIHRGLGGTGIDLLPYYAYFIVGATGGTFDLTFRQFTSNASATQINTGSILKCMRLL